MVDVSTVYSRLHMDYQERSHVACKVGSDFAEFMFCLIDTEENMTVYSNPRYPRFLCR